nr:MFS transporter [uncultured Duganella sp.]
MGPTTSHSAQPISAHQAHAPAASWTAVGAVGIGAFALVTSEFLPVGLLPQIAQDLGITPGQAGLMVTLPGIVAAVMAPFTLAFAGNVDRRRLLWILLAMLAVANLTVALASSLPAALVGRVLLGIAIGGFWTIGGSLGRRLRPGAESAKATALIFSGVSVGTVAGVPVGTLLGGMLGWRMAFGAATAVALVVVAVLILALPSLKPNQAQGFGDVGSVLKLPRVQLGLFAILMIFVGQFASYTYITPYLLQHAGIGAAAISAILFGYGAAGFAGNLLAGWAAARNTKLTLAATAALIGVSIALMLAAGSHAWLVIPLLMVWGLGFGMLPIAVQSWLFSAAPQKLEAVSAVFVSSAQASIGAGALLGGLLADHYGLSGAMSVGAVATLVTAVVVVLWRR